jgi:hypothetical protein
MIKIDKEDLKMLFDRDLRFACNCQNPNMMNTNMGRPEFEIEDVDINANNINVDVTTNNGMMPTNMPEMGMGNMGYNTGCISRPICERPIEKCVHRCIVHEVPHVCPINTRIINHHIYRHTYRPEYTCCEANEVSHINEGSCCNF